MPEINLLPDELRKKEEKELESVQKKPKVFEVTTSSPPSEKSSRPLESPKPSLLSRLFRRQAAARPQPKEAYDGVVSQGTALSPLFSKKSEEKIRLQVSAGSSDESSSSIKVPVQRPEKPSSETADDARTPVQISQRQEKATVAAGGFFSKLFRRSKAKSAALLTADRQSSAEKTIKIKDQKRRQAPDVEDTVPDVNLIPEELLKYPELELPQRLFRSGLVIFIFILLVVSAYLGITWYQLNITRQIEDLENKITEIDRAIGQAEQTKIQAQALQKRIGLVQELFGKHVYWTQFFEMLEKHTLSNVYYTDFSMVGTNQLVISAVARDYTTVGQQIVAFEEASDFVKRVHVDSAQARIESPAGTFSGVNFKISLEFMPGVFLKSP